MSIFDILLRKKTWPGLTTINQELTQEQVDNNFIEVFEQFKALNNALKLPAYSPGTTYQPSPPDTFVLHDSRIWKFIDAAAKTGVTPVEGTTWTEVTLAAFVQYFMEDQVPTVFDVTADHSNFVGAVNAKEFLLGTIPAKSMLGFPFQVIMTEGWFQPGFSDIVADLYIRDLTGNLIFRLQVGASGTTAEGLPLLTSNELVFHEVQGNNSGGFGIASSGFSSILSRNAPVNVYLRVRIDSEVTGFPGSEGALANSHEVFEVDTIADVGGALDGTFFNFDDGGGAFYVWMDIDDNGNDPAPGGRTGIRVSNIVTGESANEIAFQAAKAIVLNAASNVFHDGNKLRVIDPTQTARADAADVDTGFTVTKVTEGGGAIKQIDGLTTGKARIIIPYNVYQ